MCAGEIFPGICFIEKKVACFIVKGVLKLGLPSSSLTLCFSHFSCFSFLLYFSFASIPLLLHPPPPTPYFFFPSE